jgi:uncharacterized protein
LSVERTAPVLGQDYLLFDTAVGPHVFVSSGSMLFAVAPAAVAPLLEGGAAAAEVLSVAAPPAPAWSPELPMVTALSLEVTDACNLSCAYCYGGYRGHRQMSREVAGEALKRLFAGAPPRGRAVVGFIGGEPLLARKLIRHVVGRAERLAAEQGRAAGFSVTTNGTALTPEDARFLADHHFTVNVSLDGLGAVHDRRRGAGTYGRIMENLGPLLGGGRRQARLFARMTVGPSNLPHVVETIAGLVDSGFDGVGLAPVLEGADGQRLDASGLRLLSGAMEECAAEWKRRRAEGRPYPFTNLTEALGRLQQGSNRPHPCGAAGNYLAVDVDGRYRPCHRFLSSEVSLGHVSHGPDHAGRARWLERWHVDRQSSCASCWARYLCGGGCSREVMAVGRPHCDHVKGWLALCLRMIAEEGR